MGGYYSPWRRNPFITAKYDGEYITEHITNTAIQFLEEMRNESTPFLLFMSYYNIHGPVTPYLRYLNQFTQKAREMYNGTETPYVSNASGYGITRMRQDNAALASMVAALDESVGNVTKALNEFGLDSSTVVIFTSDNGGFSISTSKKLPPGCCLPFRGGKGWLYEGGIRVPLIIRAPSIHTPALVSNDPVTSMDLYSTILDITGLSKEQSGNTDGKSLYKFLMNLSEADGARALYWHYPHYHTQSGWRPGAAVLEGEWKLLIFFETGDIELYNIIQDVGETTNLADINNTKAQELKAKLQSWLTQTGASIPKLKYNDSSCATKCLLSQWRGVRRMGHSL
eukprot:m.305253 g.305253  ORF g.305253 m.305253 type:complete len:340 (+) comp16446_c4_seq56:141-1160(+)